MNKNYKLILIGLFIIAIMLFGLNKFKSSNDDLKSVKQPTEILSEPAKVVSETGAKLTEKEGKVEKKQTSLETPQEKKVSQNAYIDQSNSNKSETQTIGSEGGTLGITLSNNNKAELIVPENTLEEGIEITFSESEVQPYQENTIALLNVEFNASKNLKLDKHKRMLIKVIPIEGIDQARVEFLKVFSLQTRKSGRKLWDRGLMYDINRFAGEIIIPVEQSNIYKVQYSTIKVGG